MKRSSNKTRQPPRFLEGALVAFAASVFGAATWFVLAEWLPAPLVLRGITSALALAYIVYLLSRSAERTGRVSVVALWAAVTTVVAVLDPPLAIYAGIYMGLIWLVRSLYFYSSVVASLADLCLSALAVAVALWAAAQTGSVFMSLWCLFLVQALFCVIPPDLKGRSQAAAKAAFEDDRFERAHRSAEAAVRKLFAVR